MLTVLKKLQRKLRRINYLAASRTRTARSNALDWSLFASLLLAWPTAWMCNAVIVRYEPGPQIRGTFYRTGAGTPGQIHVWIGSSDEIEIPTESYVGNFLLQQQYARRGWPLRTQIDPRPVELTLDLATELESRTHAQASADDPLVETIQNEMRRRNMTGLLESWQQGNPAPDNYFGAWIANSAMWWVMLTTLSSILINVAHYGHRVFIRKRGQQRRSRSSAGCCPACGYDLTGLEYSERCPECGTLAE